MNNIFYFESDDTLQQCFSLSIHNCYMIISILYIAYYLCY